MMHKGTADMTAETGAALMDRLLTIQEVAAYLRVSQATIRRWTNAGRLRCYRLGGQTSRRLFSIGQLQTFLAQYEHQGTGV